MAARAAALLIGLGVALAAVAVALELTKVELLIVGSVTRDLLDDGTEAVGGAVSYAAAVSAAFGVRACVVTFADAALAAQLPALFVGHEVHVVPSNATLTFSHSYTFWGNHRKLRVRAAPNVTLGLHHVPCHCRAASAVILGPLTQQDVDVGSFIRWQPPPWYYSWALPRRRPPHVGLLAQGLQRSLDAAGRVAPLTHPSPDLVAAIGPGVVTFLSDVETERWGNGTLEALAERSGAHLVLTLGEKGAEELRQGRRRRHLACEVSAVVDTNGAGDSFATAYMLALAGGHLEPAAVANWAGAAAVGQPQRCKPLCVRDALLERWQSMPQPQLRGRPASPVCRGLIGVAGPAAGSAARLLGLCRGV